MLESARPANQPPASTRQRQAPAPAALSQMPASTVLIGSVVVAVLMSTEYLFQPFVWRNWPWDEVLHGWLEVVRDRVVVALMIGSSLIGASQLPVHSLRARAATLAGAIIAGAATGELLLLAGGAQGAYGGLTPALGRVLRWAVVGGSVAAMWLVWRRAAEASAAAQAVELRRVRLERQATEARLEALRGQIEPHFLFNTLATVRRLQQVEPAQGARLLAHFVDYLRSAQPARQGEAAQLGQEIDLIRAYLGVVALRMAGRLVVSFDVPDDLRALPFPPLTLATLVENAVKHGIEPAPAGGTIMVVVRRIGATLEAVVADTGVGFSGSSGSGIGLANIRARLQTLYGNAGTLKLHANLPSGVRASMHLPCPQPRSTV
ncbi:MAG: histidine kinase [Burkholderiales bacterium]|nr:histidine kinase [Burkholderiales bacterium]